MWTRSLILAFAFVVGGAFLTEMPSPEIPGVGTFHYSGSNVIMPSSTATTSG